MHDTIMQLPIEVTLVICAMASSGLTSPWEVAHCGL